MVRVDLPARTNCTVQVGEWDWDAVPVPIFDAATAVPLPVLIYPRTVREPALARELIEMGRQDQALRAEMQRSTDANFLKRVHPGDTARQQRLAKIIAEKGWPTISMVGWEAANAAWLIAQHSPQQRLKPWLSLMQKAAIKHEIRPSHLATTVDRVLVYDNKKQRYGTQSRDLNGVNTPYPIADIAQLPQLRRSVGLPVDAYPATQKEHLMNTLPTDRMRIEEEVMQAFGGLVEASKALDASRYLTFIDREKFTGLSADGKAWHSIKNLEDLVVAGFPMVEKILSLTFQNVKVTVINPTTAILVNEYQQTILLKDQNTVKQSGGGTQVWSRRDDAWKLVSISASDERLRGDAIF